MKKQVEEKEGSFTLLACSTLHVNFLNNFFLIIKSCTAKGLKMMGQKWDHYFFLMRFSHSIFHFILLLQIEDECHHTTVFDEYKCSVNERKLPKVITLGQDQKKRSQSRSKKGNNA